MKKKEPKKYKVPGELKAMWWAHEGCNDLRDRYVAVRWFGYKLAVKAASESRAHREKFWAAVYDIYPFMRDKTIQYDQYTGEVFIKPEEKKAA